MDFIPREQVMNALQQSFEAYLEHFEIDDIGIFEEEGEDNLYYMGYTVNKGGKTYHIHTPFRKNKEHELAPIREEWTIESDDAKGLDLRHYPDPESAIQELQ